MVIGIFGESCTGKSTIAAELAQRTNAKIYSGKDYIKLAKSEAEAKKQFIQLLEACGLSADTIIYVISEVEHLSLLPEKSLRVRVSAPLDTIKTRFAQRMNGHLPPPVAAMLEKKHGAFDKEPCHLHVENADGCVVAVCDQIISLLA